MPAIQNPNPAIKEFTISLGNLPYVSPIEAIGKEECHNLYPEYAGNETGKEKYYLVKIPGLKKFIPQDRAMACRAMFTTSGQLAFGVFGNELHEIIQDGTRRLRGTLQSSTGPVSIAENGYQMILVDGTAGYIYDYVTTTLTRITDEYFPGNGLSGNSAPTHVVCLDTYFLVNVPGTNQYMWSNSYYKNDTGTDYSSLVPNGYWNGLQMGMKIGKPDYIIALTDAQNMMWVFGSNSVEVHYDTGDSNNQLWARYSGALIDIGCAAPYSVAKYATQVFWLGADKSGAVGVYTNKGMEPSRISNIAIDQIVQSLPNYNDCQAFVYSQASHVFYVMHFIQADQTWVYDLTTNAWHRRTHLDPNTGTLKRWKGTWSCSAWSKLLMGDNIGNGVYEALRSYYLNDNLADDTHYYIRCEKTTPITFSNGRRFRFISAQPMMKQGSGLSVAHSQYGHDPQLSISWSNDSGYSYQGERFVSVGALGNYGHRSRAMLLGIGRNRVWKLVITDPVEVVFMSIIIVAEVLGN